MAAEDDSEEELAVLTISAENDERYKATFKKENAAWEIDIGAAAKCHFTSYILKKVPTPAPTTSRDRTN